MTHSWLEKLLVDNRNFDAAIEKQVSLNVVLALKLAFLPLLVTLIYHLVGCIVYKNDFPVPKIVRCVLIMLAISLYKPLMYFPTAFLRLLDQATYQNLGPAQEKVLLAHYKKITGHQDVAVHPEAPPTEETDKISVFGLMHSFKNWYNQWFTSLFKGINGMIRCVCIGLSIILSKLLYLFMPLSLLFSIFPTYEKAFEKCFDTYIVCLLNLTILNTLDTVMASILDFNAQDPTGDQSFSTMLLNALMSVAYCLSFWISSRVVGKSGLTDQFLSKTSAVVSAGLTMGLPGSMRMFSEKINKSKDTQSPARKLNLGAILKS